MCMCVCVRTLVFLHANNILSSVACLVLSHLLTLYHKLHDFRKKNC
jgi:hypothetical protein